ncbi:MAG: response regulator, partial [Elusimicrobia bacterium]|nr:response regulator [Elusimicrobiota bacterium]
MRQSVSTRAGTAASVLVADDEQGLRDFLTYELTERGYEVVAVADAAAALRSLRERDFDLVISDVRMPRMDGLEMLERIKRETPDVEVVLTTGYGTVDMAVRAMKDGAFDFLLKPVDSERLAAVAARAVESGELKALVALHETAHALFRSVDLEEVLSVVADAARKLLMAERATILVRDGDGRLRVAADTRGEGGVYAADEAEEACRRAEAAGAGAADVERRFARRL